MPSLQYRAINAAGRKLRGTMTAVNESDLYYRLKQIGLDLLDAKPVTESKLLTWFAKPIQARDLVELCIHLEQLEKVGVPILDSLNDIRQATQSIRLRDVLADVCRDVGNGKLPSEALALHPRVFNQVFVGLIAAGEQTGNLTESFGHLVKHLKWTDAMNRRVIKALRYPAFILATTVFMLGAMMLVLVPQLSGFLLTLNMELPAMTLALIATSNFISEFWWAILGLPLVLFGLVRVLYAANDGIAYVLDLYFYRLPVLGPTMRKIALSRFAHFFAIMFHSGIGVLQCIDTASRVVANRALAGSLQVAKQAVESGSSLTNAFTISGEFPDLVVRMIRIGEETGNLRETLENISYFYDRDVEDSVDAMIGSIQPALTVVVGLTMGWVITAVMGPVYDSFASLPL